MLCCQVIRIGTALFYIASIASLTTNIKIHSPHTTIRRATMTYLDAAYTVLQSEKQPLHYTDITRRALAQGLIVPTGLTPEATMGSRLYTDTQEKSSRFVRAGKGHVARRVGISGRPVGNPSATVIDCTAWQSYAHSPA